MWIRVNVLFRIEISLAEEFILEAEELGKFKHPLLRTPGLIGSLFSGEFSISDHDLDIPHPFGMKIRNNLDFQ